MIASAGPCGGNVDAGWCAGSSAAGFNEEVSEDDVELCNDPIQLIQIDETVHVVLLVDDTVPVFLPNRSKDEIVHLVEQRAVPHILSGQGGAVAYVLLDVRDDSTARAALQEDSSRMQQTLHLAREEFNNEVRGDASAVAACQAAVAPLASSDVPAVKALSAFCQRHLLNNEWSSVCYVLLLAQAFALAHETPHWSLSPWLCVCLGRFSSSSKASLYEMAWTTMRFLWLLAHQNTDESFVRIASVLPFLADCGSADCELVALRLALSRVKREQLTNLDDEERVWCSVRPPNIERFDFCVTCDDSHVAPPPLLPPFCVLAKTVEVDLTDTVTSTPIHNDRCCLRIGHRLSDAISSEEGLATLNVRGLRKQLQVDKTGKSSVLALHQAIRVLGGKMLRRWKLLPSLHWRLRQSLEASVGVLLWSILFMVFDSNKRARLTMEQILAAVGIFFSPLSSKVTPEWFFTDLETDKHVAVGLEVEKFGISDRWGMQREFDPAMRRLIAKACTVNDSANNRQGCLQRFQFDGCCCRCPYAHSMSKELAILLMNIARSLHRREWIKFPPTNSWVYLIAHKRPSERGSPQFLSLSGLPYIEMRSLLPTEARKLRQNHPELLLHDRAGVAKPHLLTEARLVQHLRESALHAWTCMPAV